MAVGDYELRPFTMPQLLGSALPKQVRANDNLIREKFNAHQADTVAHVQSGLLAARPVAPTVGTTYYSTDVGSETIYLYTSLGWVTVAGGGVGLSGSGTNGTIAKWTGVASLGDSIITESGAVATVTGTLSATAAVTTPSVSNAGTLALAATGANQMTLATNGVTRLTISSAGLATFANDVVITGDFTHNSILTYLAQGTTADSRAIVGGGSGSFGSIMTIRASAGQGAGFRFNSGTDLTAGLRWQVYKSGDAESGGNAGSAFLVRAYGDTGTFIDEPIRITRAASGTFAIARPVTIAPTLGIAGGSTTNALTVTTTGAIQASFRYNASTRLDVSVAATTGLTTYALSVTGNTNTRHYFSAPMEIASSGTTIRAVGFSVGHQKQGAGALANFAGAEFVATHSGSDTVTKLVGLRTNVIRNGSGAVTTAVSQEVTALTATATTAYGLLVNAITGGTTNYSIYTNAGLVRFGDAVAIDAGGLAVTGAATAAQMLRVGGTLTASGGGGRGVSVNGVLVAVANSDVLYGIDIAHAITPGAFTGLEAVALRIGSNSTAMTGSKYGIIVGAPSGASVNNIGILVSGGGITVTGNSTITGTLGGITTLTATTLAGTLATATQNSVTTMTGLTTIGTLVAGAVPASLVTAGTFGTGNYAISGLLTVTDSGNRSASRVNGVTIGYASGNLTGTIGSNVAYDNNDSRYEYTAAETGVLLLLGDSGLATFYIAGASSVGSAFTGNIGWQVDSSGRVGIGVAATSTSYLTLPVSTTSVSTLRVPHGAAPTSPVNGDIWTTTAGLYVRINGATVGPLS